MRRYRAWFWRGHGVESSRLPALPQTARQGWGTQDSRRIASLNPLCVGVEEQEEDHGERSDVHVEQQKDAAVVEAPAETQAAGGFPGSPERGECGENERPGGVDLRESGEDEGCGEAGQNQESSANKRTMTDMEESGEHREPRRKC